MSIQRIDGDGVEYEWKRCRSTDTFLHIPDHRVRSFTARPKRFLRGIFVINIYVGGDSIMQEILFRNPSGADFIPLSFEAYQALAIDPNTGRPRGILRRHCEWAEVIAPVRRDDRVLFASSRSDWNRLVGRNGVGLDAVVKSYAAGLLDMHGVMLAYATLCPAIKSLDDAKCAMDAMNWLGTNRWKHDYYVSQMDIVRKSISKDLETIEMRRKSLEQTCNSAADALNMLSERFGVDVEI